MGGAEMRRSFYGMLSASMKSALRTFGCAVYTFVAALLLSRALDGDSGLAILRISFVLAPLCVLAAWREIRFGYVACGYALFSFIAFGVGMLPAVEPMTFAETLVYWALAAALNLPIAAIVWGAAALFVNRRRERGAMRLW
jgi:hypothetical protein